MQTHSARAVAITRICGAAILKSVIIVKIVGQQACLARVFEAMLSRTIAITRLLKQYFGQDLLSLICDAMLWIEIRHTTYLKQSVGY